MNTLGSEPYAGGNSGRQTADTWKGSAAADPGDDVFALEQVGETILITPQINLGELAYRRIEAAADTVFDLLDRVAVKHVVMDFARTDYFGTTAIGFFLRVWKRVRGVGGHMAFCNLSDHAREILRFTKLDHLWTICRTRDEALKAVQH
jgi:anti-anti-sigma factor